MDESIFWVALSGLTVILPAGYWLWKEGLSITWNEVLAVLLLPLGLVAAVGAVAVVVLSVYGVISAAAGLVTSPLLLLVFVVLLALAEPRKQ